MLVRALYNFAIGTSHDQAAALEASAALRKNIMEEVGLSFESHPFDQSVVKCQVSWLRCVPAVTCVECLRLHAACQHPV